MHILSNNELSISIKSMGAELTEIFDKKTNRDYLWNAEASVWGRHAPVLFPIVGRLNKDTYSSKGKNYTLPQHGFARDMEFNVVESSDEKIVLSLEYNEETLKKYPYKFELQISYLLKGRKLTNHYKVINKQTEDLFFSIGSHPGFKCPFEENESYEDYFLEFSTPETLNLHVLKGGLISNETIPYLKNEKIIPLSYELFKNDALVFKDYQSDYISLKHKSKGEIFKFHFAGFPFLGIWSKPGPFVCIEPWHGIADFVDHNGILEEKKGIRTLKNNEIFECKWAVEFN